MTLATPTSRLVPKNNESHPLSKGSPLILFYNLPWDMYSTCFFILPKLPITGFFGPQRLHPLPQR